MKKLLAALVVVASFAVIGVNNAFAAPSTNPPTAQVVSSTTNAAVVGARASAVDIANGRVTVLAFVNARGLTRTERRNPACKQISGVWNSGKGQDGKLYWFWDTRTIRVCPSKRSPTGWARDVCANPVRTTRPPKRVIRGEVLLVRSFAQIKVRLRAEAKVRVTAVCGWAEASASSSITVTVRAWVRSRGESLNSLFTSVSGSATAKAAAQLECVTAPPPAPPAPEPPRPPTPQPPPPAPPPTPQPPKPPEPPANRPPTGDIKPPPHVIVSLPGKPKSSAPACVDNVTDPDGDSVSVSFSFSAGSWGSTYNDGSKVCVIYSAPEAVQEITMTVVLRDGKGGETTLIARFPIVPDINP